HEAGRLRKGSPVYSGHSGRSNKTRSLSVSCRPNTSDEPSLVQVMPRGLTSPGSSINFRNGTALSGSTIQIDAFALPGTPTAASRLPSCDHARNPFVSAGLSGRVEYTLSPRELTNFKYVRPGPRGSR